jgi:inhibitor of KinA
MLYDSPQLKPNGDRALRVAFGDERSLRVNRPVRALYRALKENLPRGVTELVPAYASLTVLYDPERVAIEELAAFLEKAALQARKPTGYEEPSRLLRIPICYQGEYAQDMEFIQRYTGLSRQRIIELHTQEPYRVFQLGFTPGCPFIGPLQKELHVPLMETPRTHTPNGAVAVSVGQTVIYPRATPGGMRIIGRTPVQIFQVDHPELVLFKPGDQVEFMPISPAEYQDISRRAQELFEGVEVINRD